MMAEQEPSWQTEYGTEMNPLNQTGILLLSSTLRVVYLNPEARGLLQEFTLCSGPAADVPPAIRSFCQELIQRLPASPGPTDWEGLRFSRVTGSPARSILIRAFGVPALLGGQGQLLLLLTATRSSEGPDATLTSEPVSPHQMHLTPREASIARHLLEGLTNKEIANTLSISEHTVKDHLKRLMRKYQVTTRTALVSRLLRPRSAVAHRAAEPAATRDSEIHALAG